jgi:PiT family inorganic phosphate transporter
VLIGLVFSSIVGFCLAWICGKAVMYSAILAAANNARPAKLKRLFDGLQVCSAIAMAWTHGLNDGQKFIGVFALVLLLGGFTSEFIIPWWVIAICALTMGIGTMLGGWSIIRTVGLKMTQLTSWQGFAAEFTASGIIFGVSQFGVPLSTTHVINSSIVGVAASRHAKSVRWDILAKIVTAWIFTFPICGAIAYGAALVANAMF